MKNKVLTVSIAAYNVEKYIKETLESLIITENADELEVLIINDGSNDATPVIAEKYVRLYPSIFRLVNKENGGYGSTINTAVKMASGKYFKQLDGDDWFETENLGDFIEFLRLSNADCVYSSYWEVYQHKKEKILKMADNPEDETIHTRDIVMYALTFKTKIFLEYNITITEHCFYTDCEYNIKPLIYSKTIAYFRKPIYCYRLEVAGQSVSKTGWKRHYKEHNKVTLEIMLYYEKNKGKIASQYKNEIENYVLSVYKTNFSIALELADESIQKMYKELDLVIKAKFPLFYEKKNQKMVILANSGYRSWWIIWIYHRLFEKKIFT